MSVVTPAAENVTFTDTGLALTVPRAGTYSVQLNWSPFLVASAATVGKSSTGGVLLTVPSAGNYLLHAVWRMP